MKQKADSQDESEMDLFKKQEIDILGDALRNQEENDRKKQDADLLKMPDEEGKKCLGILFKQINVACCMAFNKKMEKHNLTAPQAEILRFLEHCEGQQATQRQIETHLRLKNPTVTGFLNRLEEKNYVKRTINPKDKRSHMVLLTEESRRFHEEMCQGFEEMEERMVRGLSEEELSQLFRYLEIILHNIPD